MEYNREQIDGFVWDSNNMLSHLNNQWSKSEEINHRKHIANLVNAVMNKSDFVIDAGCGTGEVYRYLAPFLLNKECKYLGLDGSISLLDEARKSFPEIRFELSNLYGLTFYDNFCDISICIDVVQHCNYYDQVLLELFRVSKKCVFLRTWTKNGDDTLKKAKEGNYSNIYSTEKISNFIKTLTSNFETKGNGIFIIYK